MRTPPLDIRVTNDSITPVQWALTYERSSRSITLKVIDLWRDDQPVLSTVRIVAPESLTDFDDDEPEECAAQILESIMRGGVDDAFIPSDTISTELFTELTAWVVSVRSAAFVSVCER